jgi:hypothetical protein
MKKQQTLQVLIVATAITCVSYTAQAQSAGVRAVSRSTAAQSVAEQVRRDSNSINCRNYPSYVTGDGTPTYEDRRHRMYCRHGGTRRITLH